MRHFVSLCTTNLAMTVCRMRAQNRSVVEICSPHLAERAPGQWLRAGHERCYGDDPVLSRDDECPIANHAESLKAMVSTVVVIDTVREWSVSKPESRQRQLITNSDIETYLLTTVRLRKGFKVTHASARCNIICSFHWQVAHASKTHTITHTITPKKNK